MLKFFPSSSCTQLNAKLLRHSILSRQQARYPFRRSFSFTSRALKLPTHKPIIKEAVPKDQTKASLLSQTKNPFDRLKIRFKWILIRQNRPFNMDEIGALVSWIVMGNIVWIFLGTTAFFGLVFYGVNHVPEGNSRKSVSGFILSKLLMLDTNLKVKTGQGFSSEYSSGRIILKNIVIGDDENFRLNIERCQFDLSFQKWADGRGLLRSIDLSGLTGYVSCASQEKNADFLDSIFPRHYELESVNLSDCTLNMDLDESTLKLSIFSGAFNKLRKNWLAYDFFNSGNCSGSINDSLFTIHQKQYRYLAAPEMDELSQESSLRPSMWQKLTQPSAILTQSHRSRPTEHDNPTWDKITRLRIDQLDLSSFLQNSKSRWLSGGTVDIVIDLNYPSETSKQEDSPSENAPNKYIVMDFKIQFHDLKARIPQDLPTSSVTGENYLDLEQIKAITAFVNENQAASPFLVDMEHEKVSSEAFAEGAAQIDSNGNFCFPPLTFRVAQNIKDLEGLETLSILTQKGARPNTKQLVDSVMKEFYMNFYTCYQETHDFMFENMNKKAVALRYLNNMNLLLVGLGMLVV